MSKELIATLNGNSYQTETALTGYKYYEFVFSELMAPNNQNQDNQMLAARLYDAGTPSSAAGWIGDRGVSGEYSSVLYGNDDGGNAAESHSDSFLRLWPAQRNGTHAGGHIYGVMTLWLPSEAGPSYNAQIYTPGAWGRHGCQAWVSGHCGRRSSQTVKGIQFTFYNNNQPYSAANQANQIQSGSIYIYGCEKNE